MDVLVNPPLPACPRRSPHTGFEVTRQSVMAGLAFAPGPPPIPGVRTDHSVFDRGVRHHPGIFTRNVHAGAIPVCRWHPLPIPTGTCFSRLPAMSAGRP